MFFLLKVSVERFNAFLEKSLSIECTFQATSLGFAGDVCGHLFPDGVQEGSGFLLVGDLDDGIDFDIVVANGVQGKKRRARKENEVSLSRQMLRKDPHDRVGLSALVLEASLVHVGGDFDPLACRSEARTFLVVYRRRHRSVRSASVRLLSERHEELTCECLADVHASEDLLEAVHLLSMRLRALSALSHIKRKVKIQWMC